MSRARQAAGGGRVVEVAPERITGWINRFGANHGGIAAVTGNLSIVTVVAGDGDTATLAVPFPPMSVGGAEPVQALLAHLRGIGPAAAILLRGGAFSVGVCDSGTVLTSSTDTRYVQARTAAGGWSQQRYARRRENQRRDAHHAAADTAYRVLGPAATTLRALVTGGEPGAIRDVLAEPRLRFLEGLPHRTFPDIPEPRRAVLDAVAARCLAVTITLPQTSGSLRS